MARRRAFRLRIVVMIAASFAVDATFLAGFAAAGTVAAVVAYVYGLAGTLFCALQYATYRSAWSERFADSYLTLPVSLAAAGLELAFLAWAPEASAVFAAALFIICSFGALRLSVRSFALLWAAIVAGVGVVFVLNGERLAIPGATAPERMLAWLLFAATLGRCVVVWLYGAAIRASLHERNLRLTEAERAVREQAAGLEHTVQERTAALRAAVRELEDFSYSMSHNLRAPARAVIANARMIEDEFDGRLPEGAHRLLERVAAAGAQMGSMTDGLIELLGVTRAPLARRALDLSALAGQTWEQLARENPACAASLEAAPNLRGDGDEALVRRLLRLLLDNARKFSGGRAMPRVAFAALEHGMERVFFVRDNGAGFDPAYSEKLFRPFEHLHGVGEFAGQGLGLAIARAIVERHGGRIWAESAPQQGATFYFTLAAPTPLTAA